MANPPLFQRVTTSLAQPTRFGVTRGTAIVAGVGAAAALTGAGFAIGNAADLYRTRQNMADQFQDQLVFPSDLIQPGADRNFFMSFSFMKYEKRSIQNSTFLRSEGSIRLPIPDGIRDNLSVSYNTASLTPAVGAALENFTGPATGAISTITGTITDTLAGATLGALQGAAAGNENAAAAARATQAYFGLAVNPYQTVLFEKPEFKTHNFSWKIMPKNEDESNRARNIFRTFQFHASPGVSSGAGLFFSYPSMIIINLYPSSEFLYRFKPCIIKSVNVNYAAGSNPSFFKRTNAPTAMTLSVQLQEIEYWTNKDYSGEAFDETLAENRAARLARGNASGSGASGGTV